MDVSATPSPSSRLPWVDNLRSAIIILVVHFHSCITYSHVGGWYIKDGPEGTLTEKLPYIFWIFHIQSFFMGTLFFLAGAMAHTAVAKHGSAAFITERCRRLGIPGLLYMQCIHPFIIFGLLNGADRFPGQPAFRIYADYLGSGQFLRGSGPLWFVLALLVFSVVYALARQRMPQGAKSAQSSFPSFKSVLLIATALWLATALTRIVFPVGTSILNMQLSYFPQYIVLFAVGILIAKRGWLDALAGSRLAKRAGLLALVAGPILLLMILLIGGGPTEGPTPGEHGPILYFGGFNVLAFSAAFWEQFTGVGLALGALALFQRKFNRENSISRWLASRSFAVYFIHAPVLVWLTIQFQPLQAPPLIKIALLSVSGLVLSLLLAEGLKRFWITRNIF